MFYGSGIVPALDHDGIQYGHSGQVWELNLGMTAYFDGNGGSLPTPASLNAPPIELQVFVVLEPPEGWVPTPYPTFDSGLASPTPTSTQNLTSTPSPEWYVIDRGVSITSSSAYMYEYRTINEPVMGVAYEISASVSGHLEWGIGYNNWFSSGNGSATGWLLNVHPSYQETFLNLIGASSANIYQTRIMTENGTGTGDYYFYSGGQCCGVYSLLRVYTLHYGVPGSGTPLPTAILTLTATPTRTRTPTLTRTPSPTTTATRDPNMPPWYDPNQCVEWGYIVTPTVTPVTLTPTSTQTPTLNVTQIASATAAQITATSQNDTTATALAQTQWFAGTQTGVAVESTRGAINTQTQSAIGATQTAIQLTQTWIASTPNNQYTATVNSQQTQAVATIQAFGTNAAATSIAGEGHAGEIGNWPDNPYWDTGLEQPGGLFWLNMDFTRRQGNCITLIQEFDEDVPGVDVSLEIPEVRLCVTWVRFPDFGLMGIQMPISLILILPALSLYRAIWNL